MLLQPVTLLFSTGTLKPSVYTLTLLPWRETGFNKLVPSAYMMELKCIPRVLGYQC